MNVPSTQPSQSLSAPPLEKWKNMPTTRTVRRKVTLALAVTVVASVLAACSSTTSATTSPTAAATATSVKKGLTVYFIPKDTQNPYEVIADKGGPRALQELGGKVVISSGTADTAADDHRSEEHTSELQSL